VKPDIFSYYCCKYVDKPLVQYSYGMWPAASTMQCDSELCATKSFIYLFTYDTCMHLQRQIKYTLLLLTSVSLHLVTFSYRTEFHFSSTFSYKKSVK